MVSEKYFRAGLSPWAALAALSCAGCASVMVQYRYQLSLDKATVRVPNAAAMKKNDPHSKVYQKPVEWLPFRGGW